MRLRFIRSLLGEFIYVYWCGVCSGLMWDGYRGKSASEIFDEKEGKHLSSSSPVVFAVTAWDAGRKVVDYYMTWRGKTVCPSVLSCVVGNLMSVPISESQRYQRLSSFLVLIHGCPMFIVLTARRHSFLESEFRKVARSLDKEFKRASSVILMHRLLFHPGLT